MAGKEGGREMTGSGSALVEKKKISQLTVRKQCYSREICAGWCASPGKGMIGCVADGAGSDGIVMEG